MIQRWDRVSGYDRFRFRLWSWNGFPSKTGAPLYCIHKKEQKHVKNISYFQLYVVYSKTNCNCLCIQRIWHQSRKIKYLAKATHKRRHFAFLDSHVCCTDTSQQLIAWRHFGRPGRAPLLRSPTQHTQGKSWRARQILRIFYKNGYNFFIFRPFLRIFFC